MPATERIAIIIPADYGYLRSIIRGIYAYARPALPWMFLNMTDDHEGMTALKRWAPSGIVAHISRRELAETLRDLGRPVVNTSHVMEDLPFCRVGVDEAAIGRMAAQFFLQRSFSNFAFIGEPWNAYSRDRQAGYQETVAAAGHQVRLLERKGPADGSEQHPDYDEIGCWLSGLPKPAAVFAANDHLALRVAEARLLVGLRLPEDVALLGVDNDDLICNMAYPPLASVSLPGEAIGYKAAELLRSLIGGMPPPDRCVLLPPLRVALRPSANVTVRREQILV